MAHPFKDEQGKVSFARILLIAWQVVCIGAVLYELFSPSHYVLSNVAWAALTSIDLALIAWAGGPRIAQYLGPQIGATASAVAHAVSSRLPSRKDDERGLY